MTKTFPFIAAGAALILALAGCAGAERPTADQLADGVVSIIEDNGVAPGSIGEEMTDCISEALLDSELSDQTLANIARGDDVTGSPADYELLQGLVPDAIVACSPDERPTAEQLQAGLRTIIDANGASAQFTDDQVLCMAEKILESEISDASLANIAAGSDVQTTPEDQTLTATVFAESALACLS